MANPAPANTARLYYRGECNYFDLPGDNFSSLKNLLKSAKHYRHRRGHPKPQTTSMELGTAAHIAVLEPERFLREYVLWKSTKPDGSPRQRRGAEWKSFKAANDGKEIIRDAEYDEAINISRSIRDDAVAMKYLAMGRPEVSCTWVDEYTGMPCKGRVDWLTKVDGEWNLVGLKTAKSVEPWAFSSATAKFSYHMHDAFYVDGFEQALCAPVKVRVVAVENEEPYDVVVYQVPPDVLDIGRDEYRKLLERLKECREANEWPGVASGLEQVLALPPWAVPDDSDSLDDLKGWK